MDTNNFQTEQAGEVLKNLESLIKSSISDIDKKKAELRTLNDMVTSFLAQDATYQEHDKAAKEASRIKNATKSQLLKQPSVSDNLSKARDIRSEIKETQTGLSDYLREYQRMSGSSEIEDENGEIREIVYVAKLVKRSSKFR